jgi:hypothetical protein
LQKYSTPHAYPPHILNKIIEREMQTEERGRITGIDDSKEEKNQNWQE